MIDSCTNEFVNLWVTWGLFVGNGAPENNEKRVKHMSLHQHFEIVTLRLGILGQSYFHIYITM
jgi:hypothetical protein